MTYLKSASYMMLFDAVNRVGSFLVTFKLQVTKKSLAQVRVRKWNWCHFHVYDVRM